MIHRCKPVAVFGLLLLSIPNLGGEALHEHKVLSPRHGCDAIVVEPRLHAAKPGVAPTLLKC
jgi:hypothetical protein